MRRFIPVFIVLVGVAALVIDFWPGLRLPFGGADGGSRLVETKLGLDIQGGLRVEYQARPVNGKSPAAADMQVIRDIVERRVNSTGTSEPVVVTQGSDRVVVELPGVVNPDPIRKLVGQTGKLEFVPIPKGTSVSDGQQLDLSKYPPLFGGEQISSATLGTDQFSRLAIDFTLNGEGATKFATYTTNNVGNQFAIVLDGTIISAPVIQNPITAGKGQITGGNAGFTSAQANNLLTVLKYGSLPFPIQEVSVEQIAPTLGQSFLHQSILAGLIGIGLVLTLMLVHYRLPGLVASIALVYYTLVVLAIFRLIPVTLTLAGIAGFVLSIGMAVDANILIFERTKEELRAGKSLAAAVEAGFNRAWNSILDSNVSSLITATILFWFGSSVIRGFALVLIIGVLTSMFTAITVSRTILRFVVGQTGLRKAWMYGVSDDEFLARPTTGRPIRGEARGRV
ncbi:MAG TPA: protein translocase subunit SecD [Candidatus Dormibacteraeota bacterium]|nr:protein translocase subunit SecD [Candidatus Dormibacteraeota bacterium]